MEKLPQSIVVVDSVSDDETIPLATNPSNSKRRAEDPPGIDAASWRLIRGLSSIFIGELQSSDPPHDAVSVQTSSPPEFPCSLEAVGRRQRQQEDQDRAVARRFQEREEEDKVAWLRRQREQEAQDRDVATSFQQREWQKEQHDIALAEILQTEWLKEERDQAMARSFQEEEDRKISWKHQQREQEAEDQAVAGRLQRNEEIHQRRHCLNNSSKEKVLASLTAFQRQAVEYVKAKAKKMHDKSLESVKARVSGLGDFSELDIQQCLQYILDDAPIVIHLNETTLSLLVQDTHYRNLFETSTSGGLRDTKARKLWEKRMFGGAYDGCLAFERPKYGALNISGDIEGVKSARRYGQFFLILHQHCRYRCTFFNKDTGAFVGTETLATNEYYAHILNGYKDTDLRVALNTCKSARMGGTKSSCLSSNYKEVQIHGPVCLATDILALSVPFRKRTASKKLKAEVLAFQSISNCNILWQEDLLYPEDDDPLQAWKSNVEALCLN